MIKILRISVLVASSLIVTVLLLELGMRLFHYQPREVWWQWVTDPDNQKFILDTRKIYKLKKGITVDFEENTPLQTINSEGRRSSPCVSNAEKWLFVGDSFIYGHGVHDDETFPVYVYKEMQAHGTPICVVNVGVQGYSAGPSYVAFQEALLQVKPDVVVWGIRPDDFLDTAQDGIISVNNDTIVVRGAWTSGLFLQGILNKTVGRIFPQSLLVNAVMYLLQTDKVNEQYIATQTRSLPSFVTHIRALSKEHSFTLYYILTPSRSVVTDPAEMENPENKMYLSLRRSLSTYGELLVDMNAALIPVYVNHLKTFTGVNANSIFQPDGHLTSDGNMLMGKLFYEMFRTKSIENYGGARGRNEAR